MKTRQSASGLPSRTRRRAALIAALTLPLSLVSAPAIAQNPTPSPIPTSASTQPPGASSDPTLKTAWEKAAKSGKPVEVPARFTETMKVWAEPDGKNLRAELHTRPVQLKNPASGAWEPIDTRIVTRDGKLQAARVKTPLTFGGRGTKHLVSAAEEQGKVGLGVTRALPEPKISGNTITYPDAVAPGADLVVLGLADGFVSQVVFRRKPDSPVTVRLPLTLPKGTKFGKTPEGLPQLKDAKGQPKAAPIVLTAMDAKVEASPEEGKSSPVTAQVETSGKTSELVFTPDERFLADPAVTYPVTIAAASEWFGGGIPDDAWVSKNSPSSNNAAAGWLRAGTTQTSADIARVYLKFNTEVPELEGAKVIDADLYVWNYKSGGPNGQLCGNEIGTGIGAYRVTSPWTLDGNPSYNLSWSRKPSNAAIQGGSGNKAGYNIDASGTWCAGEAALVHRITGMARAWIEQDEPNHGVMLGAVTESPAINWRQYYASEYSGSPYPGYRHPPTLIVEYIPAPSEIRGIFMPYQDTDPTGAEIDANTSSDPIVRPAPEVTDDQATAMRADSPGYYMEDTTYGFGIPEEVTEQEWLDGMEATYPIGDGTDPDPGSDTTPPTVTSTVPADAATGVPINIPIKATFSEPVTEVQAAVKTSGGTSVAGTMAMDSAGTAMTFRPQQKLSADTAYTVEVSGAKDAAGNRMAAHSWSFTTEHGPQALWKFDEGTGRAAADSSGNGNDAVVSESTFWVPGKHGTALSSMTTPAIKTPATSANETSERLRFLATKEAARQSKPVEVAHETSETSITYAMPDGSYRTDITSGPVRTLKDGAWVPIDTSLIEEGGVLKPKALATGVALEISTGGTKPYAKITHRQGETSALSWPTALPKPTVKGNAATFVNAAGPGADLVITVLPTGLQQMVVLRERPEKPLELRISVAGNAALSESKDGRLLLTGKNKKLVASAPQPFMWDASAKEHPQSARRVKIATDVVTKEDHTELVLKPDQAFMAASSTVYPVRISAASMAPLQDDVEVTTNDTVDWPASPTGPFLMAGTRTRSEKSRVHLRFDTTGLAGSTVTDAKLSLLNMDAPSCGPAVGAGIQARRVTAAWDPNNLYWANMPASTTEDAQTNTAAINQSCSTWPGAMEWNVTGIAQDWAAGVANHGIALQSANETTTNNYRVYPSSEETTDFNNPPKLTITSSGPSSSPTVSSLAITPGQSAGGTTVTTSLTPQLAATVADTIGGDLTGEFEIEHDPAATGQGTGRIWAGASLAVTSGSQAAVSVPAGKLSDGWKIRWRARAVNATAASTSPWSDWQSVTVDLTGTAKTSLAQSAGPVLRTDQSFTVGAWLRWTSADAANSVLEQKGSNTTPFRFGNDPQHGLVFTLGRTDENGTTAEGALSGVKPPVNEWFHLAGVYDSAASKVTLYLNGAEIKNAPISFPAWNATGPMLLGADMAGDLDEVFAYQKALSADQIGMVHTAATSVTPTTTAKTTTKRLNTTAAAKKFPYGHISTNECRRVRPVAPSAVATTGSYSLCYSYLVGEREMKGPPGAQWEAGRWTAHMVIVVHSYVGHMIGKANEYQARPSDVPIGRTLASRKIRMQIQMGPVSAKGSFLDDWDDRWMRVYSGAAGCTADANDGAHKTVEDWAEGGIHEVILDRTSDDNSPDADKKSSCTINPNVRYTTHAFWVRKDLENPHTFRCDSSRAIRLYSSGCVLSTLRPVLIFDENNANEIQAARHVWTALYDPAITYPKVGSGPTKKIPGAFIPHAPSCANLCLRRSTSKAVENANRGVAIPECKKIRNYVKPDSCDEYPFATTLQGAGQTNTGYNYSVAIIHESQNCAQGGLMVQWYQRNRILDLDSYWVDVIRQGYSRPHSGAPGAVAHDPTPTPISLATCTIDGVS